MTKELFLLSEKKQGYQNSKQHKDFIFFKACSDFTDTFCVLLKILPPSGDAIWPCLFNPSQ